MTRIAAPLGLFIALFIGLAACDRGSSGMDEQTARDMLAQRETIWLASYGDADSTRMSGILADGFTITFPDGRQETRADLIGGLDQPGRTAQEVNHYTENRSVALNGDTAVVSGIYVSPGRGQRPDIRMRYTDTWIYRDGTWQVLASHLSSVG